tara:strand:+ start:14 stop:163 length:150 start_codon:yes stop_codon:yes gene_type:complete
MTWKAIILTFLTLAILAFGREHPWTLAGIAAGSVAAIFLAVIASRASRR